jgi:aquaporin Z
MVGVHPQRLQEQQSHQNFLNPAMELRRIFAEMWGTFLLVLVSAGVHTVAAESRQITLGMEASVAGLIVMSIIYFMGSVSGAHVNPVVTLAFSIRGNFPWSRVPGYLIAQFIGGVLAAYLLHILFGSALQEAITSPHGEYWKALVIEILLTTGLINIILSTATGARNIGHNGAIAIGGYIILSGLWADPISGASMNPIRSLSVDIVCNHFSSTWIYLIGPFIGALIAVLFEWILKGSPTEKGTENAQGHDSFNGSHFNKE